MLAALTFYGARAESFDTLTSQSKIVATKVFTDESTGFSYQITANPSDKLNQGKVTLTSVGSQLPATCLMPCAVSFGGYWYGVSDIASDAFDGVDCSAVTKLHITEEFAAGVFKDYLGKFQNAEVVRHNLKLTNGNSATVELLKGNTYQIGYECGSASDDVTLTWAIDPNYPNTASFTVDQNGLVTIEQAGYGYVKCVSALGESIEFTVTSCDFVLDDDQYTIVAQPTEGSNGQVAFSYANNFDAYLQDLACEVPATVTIDGKTYDVVAISSSAFQMNFCSRIIVPKSVVDIKELAFHEIEDYLEELVLGESVKTIGVDAFETCKNLVDVISLNPEAPTLMVTATEEEAAFEKTTLHISASALASYQDKSKVVANTAGVASTAWTDHFAKVICHELKFVTAKASVDVNDGESAKFTVPHTCIASVVPLTRAAADDSESLYAKYSYLEWKSDNEDVATVDADGVVTPVKMGSCNITATSIFGDTQTLALTVEDRVTTGIDNVTAGSDSSYRAYSLEGVEVTARPLPHGIYVVVASDGTASKRAI